MDSHECWSTLRAVEGSGGPEREREMMNHCMYPPGNPGSHYMNTDSHECWSTLREWVGSGVPHKIHRGHFYTSWGQNSGESTSPILCPNFFIFIQFSGKVGRRIDWRPYPPHPHLLGWRWWPMEIWSRIKNANWSKKSRCTYSWRWGRRRLTRRQWRYFRCMCTRQGQTLWRHWCSTWLGTGKRH